MGQFVPKLLATSMKTCVDNEKEKENWPITTGRSQHSYQEMSHLFVGWRNCHLYEALAQCSNTALCTEQLAQTIVLLHEN